MRLLSVSVLHEDRNGHFLENLPRRVFGDELHQVGIAIGSHGDHFGVHVGSFLGSSSPTETSPGKVSTTLNTLMLYYEALKSSS